MACFLAPSTRSDEAREPIITETATAMRRLSSSIRRRPLMEFNEDVSEASRQLARQISRLEPPTFVNRETATVNLGATTDHGKQGTSKTFKRLTSMVGSGPVLSTTTTRSDLMAGGAVQEEEPAEQTEKAAREQRNGTNGDSKQHPRLQKLSSSKKFLHSMIRREVKQQPTDEELDMTEQTRLAERLARLKLSEVEQRGDGNCQFRSISHQLYDNARWHLSIRQKAVAHIRAGSEYFEGFLGEDLEDYIEEMSDSGTWGDELTLRAASDSLGAVIHVITSEAENWYMVYEPTERLLEKEIFLSYISPIHYNSLKQLHRSASAPSYN